MILLLANIPAQPQTLTPQEPFPRSPLWAFITVMGAPQVVWKVGSLSLIARSPDVRDASIIFAISGLSSGLTCSGELISRDLSSSTDTVPSWLTFVPIFFVHITPPFLPSCYTYDPGLLQGGYLCAYRNFLRQDPCYRAISP